MSFQERFSHLFQKLDDDIVAHNRECVHQNELTIGKQTLKIVGQIALLVANLPFEIVATADVDYLGRIDHVVYQKLKALLQEMNLHLESDSHLIWMPDDTTYLPFYQGIYITALVAHPRDVLRAKEKFNRPKDATIIRALKNYFGNKNE